MIRSLLLAAAAAACFVSGAARAQEAAPAPADAATQAAQAPLTVEPPATQPAARPVTPLVPAHVGAAPAATSLLQTILALLVVLGTLVGLAWALKRFGPRPAAGASNLHVVGALNLGGRERIMVVEVGDQWIVVGASPGRINALATMPRQQGIAASQADAATAPQAPNFAQWLKQTIEKRNAK